MFYSIVMMLYLIFVFYCEALFDFYLWKLLYKNILLGNWMNLKWFQVIDIRHGPVVDISHTFSVVTFPSTAKIKYELCGNNL